MTSDPSNYHREYSPYGLHSLFQFEGYDVKNSIEYSFVFFKCLVMQSTPVADFSFSFAEDSFLLLNGQKHLRSVTEDLTRKKQKN